METTDNSNSVKVKDFDMPFGSMVYFMIKWVLASIPAFLIIVILLGIVSVVVGGMFGGALHMLFR